MDTGQRINNRGQSKESGGTLETEEKNTEEGRGGEGRVEPGRPEGVFSPSAH